MKDNTQYICPFCDYIYDPAEHDGVPFEELPEDWTCPLCGAGKEHFEVYRAEKSPADSRRS